METYKDKLNSFTDRIKNDNVKLQMQKVKQVSTLAIEKETQLNVELPKSLMKKLKSYCIEKDLKIKEFILLAINNELKKE